MPRSLVLAPLVVALTACGDPEDPAASAGDTESSTGNDTSGPDPTGPGATSSTTGTTETPDDPTSTTQAPATDTATVTTDPATDTATVTTDPGEDTLDLTGGSGSTGTTGDPDDTTGGVDLPTPELPAPTMPCPKIENGTVEFEPEGLQSPRAVRIWVDLDAAAELDGPVVFYWYGTGGNPDQTLSGIGELGIQEILDAGGMVVAPTHDPMAGLFPWYLVQSEKLDDLLVADEVLACAQEQLGVDARRIHALGFSAGALHTAHMSIRRSSYMASVSTYSGGLIFGAMPTWEDPDSAVAAMIFHGGPNDVVVVGFEQASEDYQEYLTASGNFSFLCDHGNGHAIPDATDDVMQFLFDHPYGTAPSPYMNALPGDFPDYCALP